MAKSRNGFKIGQWPPTFYYYIILDHPNACDCQNLKKMWHCLIVQVTF